MGHSLTGTRATVADVSKAKAKKILRHGSVRGHALSKKQKGLFGAIAGGNSKKK